MSEASSNKTPLEDVMAAMDVVDTLRHDKSIVDRELDNQGRRERLLDKLRKMYAAQGIDVTDKVLLEGIDALEQQRFQYQPVSPSFSTKLAHLYVARKKWKKPFGFAAIFASLFGSVHFFNDVLPERQVRAALPQQITAAVSEIKVIAKQADIIEQASEYARLARVALNNEQYDQAQQKQQDLNELVQTLRQSYIIKIVSRPNELSGVFRIPDVNSKSKNYYLIVEALNAKNRPIELPIVSEETGKLKQVSKWGLRVDEATYYKVGRDKKDDGIIQSNLVGQKKTGYLKPNFSIKTTGATITEW